MCLRLLRRRLAGSATSRGFSNTRAQLMHPSACSTECSHFLAEQAALGAAGRRIAATSFHRPTAHWATARLLCLPARAALSAAGLAIFWTSHRRRASRAFLRRSSAFRRRASCLPRCLQTPPAWAPAPLSTAFSLPDSIAALTALLGTCPNPIPARLVSSLLPRVQNKAVIRLLHPSMEAAAAV